MAYAIVGFGAVGQALARAFARRNLPVSVASRRSAEELGPVAKQIGPTVTPRSLKEALQADIVILAVPFWQHREVALALASWQGKTVIDATNAFDVPVGELDGLPSSAVIAKALPGARLVKGFNHLPARVLAEDPAVKGGRRVVFLASDDDTAVAPVAALAEQLGFAPVGLGTLAEGGSLVQARGRTWAPLIFQDLVSFKQQSLS